jgi:hypothetical protein
MLRLRYLKCERTHRQSKRRTEISLLLGNGALAEIFANPEPRRARPQARLSTGLLAALA